MKSEVRAFLGLGSNQGDRAQMLARAQDLLLGPRIHLVARSHVYESPPWGVANQPWFLNQAIEIQTTLSPRGLLARCQEVEQSLGRLRTVRWGPRTIDVDILLYDDVVMTEPDLVIPHQELRRRAFVLVPLAEIAPGLRLPTGEAVAALLDALPDRGDVRVVS